VLSAELKVNGTLIAHVYARNVAEAGGDVCVYDYEYYQVESRRVHNGTVRHARSKGLRKLIVEILTDVPDEVEEVP